MKTTLLLWYAGCCWLTLLGAAAAELVELDAAHECTEQLGCGSDANLEPSVLAEEEELQQLQPIIQPSQKACFALTSAEPTDQQVQQQDYGQACLTMLDSEDDDFPYTFEITLRITEPDFWFSDAHTWAGTQGSYPMTTHGEPALEAFPSTTSFLPSYRMRVVKSMLSLQGIPQECCQMSDSEQEEGVLIQLLAHATLQGLDGTKETVWSSGGSGSAALASLLRIPCCCPNETEVDDDEAETESSMNAVEDEPAVSPFCNGASADEGRPHCTPGNESPIYPIADAMTGAAAAEVEPLEQMPSSDTADSRKLQTAPPCGPSIRRAWHDTSCEDRAIFLNAVELLYKLPATNTLGIPNYHDFVRMHQTSTNSRVAHGADDGPFLSWHRWYVWKYEQALQKVSGTCVTLPFWDWVKDKGREMQATVLKANSFGSSAGINTATWCVTEGLARSTGFWNKTFRTGGCLKRGFSRSRANFTSETEILRLVMNFPSFGKGLSGFSNNLQGRPHAIVHNFMSQDFNTMYAPDDPLFMLHHCNVDRVWALYQDYWQQDQIDRMALSTEEYQTGRGIALDTALPYAGAGIYPAFMRKPDGTYPTPRDLHHSYGDLVRATYANDYLGLLLSTTNVSYVAANNQSWIQLATGPVNEIICPPSTRRLQATEEPLSIAEVNAMLGIPDDVPPWSDVATRIMWNNLTSQGLSAQDALNTITFRECESHGNPVLVSPDWIAMTGMSSEYFRCFNSGEPSDCIPDISVVSSGSSLVAEGSPVHILNYGKTTVDFSLSQVWKPGVVDMVALHYVDVDGIERCATVQSVFTGEFGSYKAQCSDKKAGMMLYVKDATVTDTTPAAWMTAMCTSVGVPLVGTIAYSISIPCSLKGPQCPPPSASDPLCDGSANFAVASETFDKVKGAPGWLFSNKGLNKVNGQGNGQGNGSVLKPNRGTSKTYQVPVNANSLTITLEITELDCSKSTDVSLYVGNEPIALGIFDCSLQDARSFYSGSVHVDVASEANAVDKVTLTIPPSYYEKKGRLMLGMRNSVIGIQSVTITADCTNKMPTWEEPEVLGIIDQVSPP